jgi:hypothetical protein
VRPQARETSWTAPDAVRPRRLASRVGRKATITTADTAVGVAPDASAAAGLHQASGRKAAFALRGAQSDRAASACRVAAARGVGDPILHELSASSAELVTSTAGPIRRPKVTVHCCDGPFYGEPVCPAVRACASRLLAAAVVILHAFVAHAPKGGRCVRAVSARSGVDARTIGGPAIGDPCTRSASIPKTVKGLLRSPSATVLTPDGSCSDELCGASARALHRRVPSAAVVVHNAVAALATSATGAQGRTPLGLLPHPWAGYPGAAPGLPTPRGGTARYPHLLSCSWEPIPVS